MVPLWPMTLASPELCTAGGSGTSPVPAVTGTPPTSSTPVAERGPARRRRDQAASTVCQRCPVITLCRRYALNAQEPYGVWGGLSEDDRANLLRAGAGQHQGRSLHAEQSPATTNTP